jgi:hypothetical protein
MIAIALWAMSCPHMTAQAGTNTNNPAQPSPTLPFTTQVKKAVVFLQTDCLHDFAPDLAQLTPDALAKVPPQQLIVIRRNLTTFLMQLQKLKQSMAKLTSEETAMLKPEALSSLELLQMGKLVAKMANLTDEDLKKLTPKEVATLPTDSKLGTGFVVIIPSLPVPAGEDAKNYGFGYLVTNRHVVQPGIEDGKPPCHVLNYFVMLNRKSDSTQNPLHVETISLIDANWHFSTDESVDLAVIPFSAPPKVYDYERIPVDLFVTQEMADKNLVVEGDPVLFSGLFIQSFQKVHTLEPIVRSGTLAMIPNEAMETTLHKLGRVYLAEAHSFGGNSGSPVFVDIAKFTNPIGFSYKLLGVISGEILESSDFTLHVATSYTANLAANSDISVVVPASEIKSILDSPSLQAERDAYVAHQAPTK